MDNLILNFEFVNIFKICTSFAPCFCGKKNFTRIAFFVIFTSGKEENLYAYESFIAFPV